MITNSTKNEQKRICLRKLELKDADLMLEWMHDISIAKHYRQNFLHMTRNDAIDFINKGNDEKNQHFAIVDQDDEYLGTISLKNISMQDLNAEYAIIVRPQKQFLHVGTEATKLILDYAFFSLGLHRVYLNVIADNITANTFYVKRGFKFEGTFKEHLYIHGEFKDLNWYGITKEQHQNSNT